jgi:hypothetical protein
VGDKPKVNASAQKARSLPGLPKPATQPSDVVPFAADPAAALRNPKSAKTSNRGESGAKSKPLPPVVTASPDVAKQGAAAGPVPMTIAVEPTTKIAADEPAPRANVDWEGKAPAVEPALKTATAQPVAKTAAAVERVTNVVAAEPADELSAVEPTAKLAPSVIPTLMPIGEETVNETYTKIEDNAQNFTAKATTGLKSAMEKGSQGIGELVEFSKGNLEAAVASSRVAASGVQEMATHAAAFGRTSMEKAKASAQQFAGVKTPMELFQLQSELAKSSLETFAAEATKFGESYMKLLGEIAQPLQNRYELAVEKVKTTVAA